MVQVTFIDIQSDVNSCLPEILVRHYQDFRKNVSPLSRPRYEGVGSFCVFPFSTVIVQVDLLSVTMMLRHYKISLVPASIKQTMCVLAGGLPLSVERCIDLL